MKNKEMSLLQRLRLSLKPAEKPTSVQTAAAFFAERKGRPDKEAAVRFLTRAGGETPRPGDEMPD